jgi:hypothetical protein
MGVDPFVDREIDLHPSKYEQKIKTKYSNLYQKLREEIAKEKKWSLEKAVNFFIDLDLTVEKYKLAVDYLTDEGGFHI